MVPGYSSHLLVFNNDETGEWIRVIAKSPAVTTVAFNYSDLDDRPASPAQIFKGLATVNEPEAIGGLLYGLGNNRRVLGVSATIFENGTETATGYYELDSALNLAPKSDPETDRFIRENFIIPEHVIEIDKSSVLIVDDQNRRWRLPLGNDTYKKLTDDAQLRICREVVTERDLFNVCGTFYELPAENADGFAKIRPIASHDFRIHDYASYRGMLVMTGINPDAKGGKHIIKSTDGKAAVWTGVIDDLWEMGKPVGHGGPWKNSAVKAGQPSDPYLIAFYDKRQLELSHDSDQPVTFRIEVDPIGHGFWMVFKEITVHPNEVFKYTFPQAFEARWIRFVSNTDCSATAWLEYK
jgi:hypothetical protein